MAMSTNHDNPRAQEAPREPGIFIGTADDDQITGSPWHDLIEGGQGNDKLAGAAGRNFYYWHYSDLGGTDLVEDFFPAKDTLVFDGVTATNLSLTTEEMDTVVVVHGEDGAVLQRVVLLGVDLGDGTPAAKLEQLLSQGAISFDTYEEDECENPDDEGAANEGIAFTANGLGNDEAVFVADNSEQAMLQRMIDDGPPLH
ncbi:MAG: hypothetical protein JO171_01555 [Paludibacterium sp.]|uniref:hypothetical protein n=1 Tax=Paludibacterium sp. TaxID=1917523 RepID=UPI0025E2B18D|nr:hypothetical protein [Paludibacterium sp.]MBV8045812.1 hypothetical protein [Paludibacterium sp.]MBV8647083.1 hypothetical protein [Paludibacterium sp.]